MNAGVSPDAQTHILHVACTKSDTFTQNITFVFTNMPLFVQNASHSCNSEFCRL